MSTLYMEYGGDLVLNQHGGLLMAVGWDEIRQRIERRLLTNPAMTLDDGTPVAADYLQHPSYGVGLPEEVGRNWTQAQAARITQKIAQGVVTDASVDPTAPPTLQVKIAGQHLVLINIGITLIDQTQGQIPISFTI